MEAEELLIRQVVLLDGPRRQWATQLTSKVQRPTARTQSCNQRSQHCKAQRPPSVCEGSASHTHNSAAQSDPEPLRGPSRRPRQGLRRCHKKLETEAMPSRHPPEAHLRPASAPCRSTPCTCPQTKDSQPFETGPKDTFLLAWKPALFGSGVRIQRISPSAEGLRTRSSR